MNRFTFTFTIMLYKADPLLSSILNQAMSSGIKIVRSGITHYYLDIVFNDGSKLIAWNGNKYYAWLSIGQFTYPDKKDGIYKWNEARPSKRTMLKLYRMLEKITY